MKKANKVSKAVVKDKAVKDTLAYWAEQGYKNQKVLGTAKVKGYGNRIVVELSKKNGSDKHVRAGLFQGYRLAKVEKVGKNLYDFA